MRKKAQESNYMNLIEGQISVFDLLLRKAPEKVAKTEVLVTKKPIMDANTIESSTKLNEIKPQHQKITDKYKQDSKLNRIIQYCGGGIGIELKDGENFKTIYVNGKGIEEFSYPKKSQMIDLDKVIWDKEQQEQQEDPLDVKKIKIGDYVEAFYGKEIIQGEIVHIYGLNNWILNISFDNHTKQTAIGRQAVRKILKVA